MHEVLLFFINISFVSHRILRMVAHKVWTSSLFLQSNVSFLCSPLPPPRFLFYFLFFIFFTLSIFLLSLYLSFTSFLPRLPFPSLPFFPSPSLPSFCPPFLPPSLLFLPPFFLPPFSPPFPPFFPPPSLPPSFHLFVVNKIWFWFFFKFWTVNQLRKSSRGWQSKSQTAGESLVQNLMWIRKKLNPFWPTTRNSRNLNRRQVKCYRNGSRWRRLQHTGNWKKPWNKLTGGVLLSGC